MSKRSPKPPKVFDPVRTARAQAGFNKTAAIDQRSLNAVDQYTPHGSLIYESTGKTINGIPGLRSIQKFSPGQQALFDQENRSKKAYGEIGNKQLESVRDKLATAFTTESLGDRPTFDTSSLGERPEYNEARREQTLSNILARSQPERNRQRQAFETNLINQGFTKGTGGYESAFDERNRADNDFQIAADLASGQESRSEFDQESRARQQGYNELLTGYNTQATERDRAVNELLQQRNQPLSELSSLLTGSQPQNPSFINSPQGGIAAPDYSGLRAAEQNALQENYKQAVKSRNARLSGLASLLGTVTKAAFGFSDRSLKCNIKRVGTLANGLAVYAFDYIWGGPRQIGLMADEVKKLHPDAVITIGGYMAVNYNEAIL